MSAIHKRAGYHPPPKKGSEKKDPQKKSIIHSAAWRRLRLLALQRDHYLCQHCLGKNIIRKATEVHHIKPRSEHPELALDLDNLVSLCWDCHEETKPRGAELPLPPVRIIKIRGTGDIEKHPKKK